MLHVTINLYLINSCECVQVEVCSHRTLVSKMESLGRCLVDLRGIDKNLTVTDWFSLRQAVVVERRASLPR